MATMVLPSFSGSLDSLKAAANAAPEDIPTRRPSLAASNRDAFTASLSSTVKTESTTEASYVSGTKPAPMPWIPCFPGIPVDSTADVAGSTATTLTSGLCFFKAFPEPLKVPPVPTPATRKSTFPPVSFQISSPVVLSWTAGLAGLTGLNSGCPAPGRGLCVLSPPGAGRGGGYSTTTLKKAGGFQAGSS